MKLSPIIPTEYDIASLIPHAGNMILIDQLLAADQDSATAVVMVSNEGLFQGAPDIMPAWVGIEYMAQTIAAWAGYHARLNNAAVSLGFLIGSRKYRSNVGHFEQGAKLFVHVNKSFQDHNGLASFMCSIDDESDSIQVSAQLNVFQPNDEQIKAMMETGTG